MIHQIGPVLHDHTRDMRQNIHTFMHTRDSEIGIKQQDISLTFNSRTTFLLLYHVRE